jgi:tetratricopeptide (TPR) repeat protein
MPRASIAASWCSEFLSLDGVDHSVSFTQTHFFDSVQPMLMTRLKDRQSRIPAGRLLGVAIAVAAMVLSSCSLDPNVRKQKYFQSGKQYFDKGKYSEASIQFNNAIRIDAGFADAHLQLAETYLKLQQSERAEQEYSEVIRLRPGDDQTRITMANLLVSERKFVQAEEQANLLLRQRPADPAVHALDAALLAGEGKIPGAIAETQKTIALAPGRWEPYLSLALLQIKNGDSAAGEASLKKVSALDPQSVEARVLLGNFYASGSRLDEAEHEFREAMTASTQNMEAREALAKLLAAEHKNAAAEQVLLDARRDLPNDPQSTLDLSNFYFTSGDLNKAVAQYDSLYRERPNDLQLKKKYIQLLIQVKRYDDAHRLDEEILRGSPQDTDALIYRSQMQISEGRAADAVQTLQGVIRNAPEDSEAHYALGVAFQKQGDLEHARAEWEETLRLNPGSVDAERSIANAAVEKGDMRSLESSATELIRLEPRSAEGYALRALAHINMQQFQAAEQDAHQAIATDPQNALGYVQLGNLRLSQSQHSQAIAAFQEALKRNPNSLDSLRGLVSVHIAEKQPDKAVSAVKLQIDAAPANSAFYALLGDVLFHGTRDLNSAQAALEKSTALDAHNSAAWMELCEVQAAKGQIKQAITVGERALAANPGRVDLMILLGNLYESSSDWSHAQQAYHDVLAIRPRDPLASLGLARILVQTAGNLDDALALVQTAREQLPNSPAVFDAMGWIYYHRGAYPLALNSLEEALRLAEERKLSNNPDMQYHIGMVYAKLKQTAQAREHLNQVLTLDPAYPHASEIKQELSGLQS